MSSRARPHILRILIGLLLIAAVWPNAHAIAPDSHTPPAPGPRMRELLGDAAIAAIRDAAKVRTFRRFNRWPVGIHGLDLTPDQIARLQQILLSDGSYGWEGAKRCLPETDAELRFENDRGETTLTVELCFSCKMWMFFGAGNAAEDYDPCAAALEALTLEAFPEASSLGQANRPVPAKRLARLARGVNISHWLWLPQSKDPAQSFITAADMKQLRDLGLTHIRLPFEPDLVWDVHTHTLRDEGLAKLRAAITLATDAGLAVIVDPHPSSSSWASPDKNPLPPRTADAPTPEQSGYREELGRFWRTLADALSTHDPEWVFFEVVNEPHDLADPAEWGVSQMSIIGDIFSSAPRHTCIATGDDWGNITGLLRLHPKPDLPLNIVYSFHFYEPHVFTHQGASWGWPPWVHIKSLPYPSTPAIAEPIASAITHDQARAAVTNYGREQWNAERIRSRIEAAASWARANSVPLYCGEFGVYRQFSPPASRLAWLNDVRRALEDHDIGWAMWDYAGGFSLGSGPAGSRSPDRDTAAALGLPAPADRPAAQPGPTSPSPAPPAATTR